MRPDPGESQNQALIPKSGSNPKIQAQIPQAGAIHTEDFNQDNQLTRDIHYLKIKLKPDSREAGQPPKQ